MPLINPFQLTDAPDHMVLERRLRHRHMYQTMMLALLLGLAAFYAAPMIVWMYRRHMTFGWTSVHAMGSYFAQLWGPDPWAPHRVMLHQPGFVPGFLSLLPGDDDPHLRVMLTYMAITGGAMIAGALRQLTNPYRRMVMKQDASWCDAATLRRMEERGQVGIRGGYLMALGKWQGGLRHGQHVRMIETLSCLCLAPPGTGKTAGLVVPSIVTCDRVSIIANDRKPELHEMTGGYRQTVSHVIKMDWSAMDVHAVALDADTKEPVLDADGNPVMIHTFHPRFNPLSPLMVPPPGPDRDTYVSTVANVLIPSKADKGSNDGDYFSNKGRDALTGMIHMILARVNDRLPDDPLRYKGMPQHWHGKEASLGMLVDWIAHSQYAASNDETEDENGYAQQEEGAAAKDRIGSWIKALCDEINPETKLNGGPDALRGTTARGFGSLSQLISMADRERSGILGTMDQALLPFKNESVKQRTEACDFTPDDMRGIQGPDGVWKPVTLYVCVNQAEADAFATITALLFEVLSRSLLTYKPNAWNPRTKRQLGPFPVCFCLDEFAKLPRISAVIEGPDIGRGMGVSYLVVAQSYGQIEKIYSKPDIEVINTVTAVKFILPQNDASTTEAVAKMVGKTTIRRPAHSFKEGLSKDAHGMSWNRSDTMEETDFLRHQEIMAMPQGTHILIVQENNNRPMKLTTVLFFKNPEIAAKVRSRGVGPIATEILPRHVRTAREAEYAEELARKNATIATRQAAVEKKSIRLDKHVTGMP